MQNTIQQKNLHANRRCPGYDCAEYEANQRHGVFCYTTLKFLNADIIILDNMATILSNLMAKSWERASK